MKQKTLGSAFLTLCVSLVMSATLFAQTEPKVDPTEPETLDSNTEIKVDVVDGEEIKEALEPTPLPLDQIRNFADIFMRIKVNYVEPVSDETLLDYAIEGMLHGLDPHSVYLKDEGYEQLNEGTRGAFNGLGMEVIMEDGFVKVIAPIDDTPAAAADIRAGDLIIRIDGKTVSGLTLQEATDQMRGEPGSSIKLTILREDTAEPFDVELTRAVVRLNSVKRKRISDDIGYLRVTQFQIATAENFRKELKMLRQESEFKGLILDLRNNPGGLVTSAVSVADSMLEGGTIVSTKSRYEQNNQSYKATETDLLDGKPVVVLINGGSASASEIVAGALQDHKRALILGTPSFGKGSVQTVMNVGEKEAIKLTTARYYTPNGHSIQAAGIQPDVFVEYREFKDSQERVSRLKENDLPGRLDNDDAPDSKKKPEKDSGLTKKEAEIRELLSKDYQLNEAVNVLKGILLYSKT